MLDVFTDAVSLLTTVWCIAVFIYLISVYEAYHSSVVLGLSLLVGVTGLFGLANLFHMDIDFILYPVRLVIIGYIMLGVHRYYQNKLENNEIQS